jgi:hypothetical protein
MGGCVIDFHEGILSDESGLVNGISRIIEIYVRVSL